MSMTQQGTLAQIWWQMCASVSRSPTAQPRRHRGQERGQQRGQGVMLPSTMKIEMDRPYLTLAWLFARGHVYSDFYLSWVFVPAWHGCLADTSNARCWRFGKRIQMRVFL